MEITIKEFKPSPISFNFEELKTELTNKLEAYKGLAYNDDQIKEAKNDKSRLNALVKSIEAKRIEVKKQQEIPYLEFEAKMKELVNLAKAPLEEIDAQIKKFEAKKEEEKREVIETMWEAAIEKIGIEKIPLKRIWNERWLNISYSIKEIEKEMLDFAAKFETALQVIEAKTEFKDELLTGFWETLDLGLVLQREAKLQAAKKAREEAEAAKKAQQAAQAQVQTQFTPQVTQQVQQPAQQQVAQAQVQPQQPQQATQNQNQEETLILKFLVTPEQKEALRNFIIEYKIPAKVINQQGE